ncbi:MFS transporter [Christensenellaceae bacterium OttesenSCG-928-K19]|nr:MFS transporter [Christensenellaceae bacterium OttesenSCG-928-K19]
MKKSEKPATHRKFHYAWLILLACCVLNFSSSGIILSMGIFYIPVSADLGITVTAFSFYITIGLIVRIAVMPFSGRLMDKLPTRPFVSVIIAAQAATLFCMSTFTQVEMFYAAGIVYGFTTAFTLYIITPVLLASWFHTKLDIALVIASIASGIGGILSQTIGSNLIASIGWRNVYAAFAIFIAITVLPFTLFVIARNPEKKGLCAYGLQDQITASTQSGNTKHSITKKQYYKNPLFIALIILCLSMGYTLGIHSHIPTVAISLGYTVALSGVFGSIIGIGNLVFKPPLGVINHRLGVDKTTALLSFIGIIGLGLCLIAYPLSSWLLYPGTALFGIYYSISIFIPVIVRNRFGNESYGSIYSFAMTALVLGSAISTTADSAIYDNSGSYITALILHIAIAAAGMLYYNFIAHAKKNGNSPS